MIAMITRYKGPLLVALAALLWATDALFRVPSLHRVSAVSMVFFEHAIGVLILAPWMIKKHGKNLFLLDRREWVSAGVVGILGSAFATVLFTESFATLSPSIPILLQKLQPIIVTTLAVVFLGEKITGKFLLWSGAALASATLLTHFSATEIFWEQKAHSLGIVFALGSTLLWAISTVAGKVLLKRRDPLQATFWRFVFGLGGLTIVFALEGGTSIAAMASPEVLPSLLYMSLVPGLFAMIAYYAGLEKTPASVVTVVELVFPVCAMILNALFLEEKLTSLQLLMGGALLLSVTLASSRNLKA